MSSKSQNTTGRSPCCYDMTRNMYDCSNRIDMCFCAPKSLSPHHSFHLGGLYSIFLFFSFQNRATHARQTVVFLLFGLVAVGLLRSPHVHFCVSRVFLVLAFRFNNFGVFSLLGSGGSAKTRAVRPAGGDGNAYDGGSFRCKGCKMELADGAIIA